MADFAILLPRIDDSLPPLGASALGPEAEITGWQLTGLDLTGADLSASPLRAVCWSAAA